MGVRFITCESCGRNFPDCGPYFCCSGCYANFCSKDCGGRQVVIEESDEGVPDEEYREEVTSCILCRLESVSDQDMVRFLLKKFDLKYDQALEMYRQENKNDETEA